LGVDSVVGQGSTFWFELPVAEQATILSSRARPSLVRQATSSPAVTVLYIEDDVANVQLVERLLLKRPSIRLITALQGCSESNWRNSTSRRSSCSTST